MVDVAPLLDLALHMATRADDIALAGFGADVKADFKPDGSPVTRVDREIESTKQLRRVEATKVMDALSAIIQPPPQEPPA